MMHTDTFFNVRQTLHKTTAGDVPLPIRYYEVSTVFFFFWVAENRLRPLIPKEMNICRYLNGKALCGLAFFNYRRSDIGVYNEVALASAVYPANHPAPFSPALNMLSNVNRRKTGFYIHHLTVSTDIACAAGREIWNFPKFTTELLFRLDTTTFSGAVNLPDNDTHLFKVDTQLGKSVSLPGFDLLLYSIKDDALLRTIVSVRAPFKTCRPKRFIWTFNPSEHPFARSIEQLGLHEKTPFICQYTDRFQSLLHAGTGV